MVAPFIILFIFWLLSGFFVRSYVDKLEGKIIYRSMELFPSKKSKPKIKVRFFGAVLTCFGFCICLYGNFFPFQENIFTWALGFSLICMTLGHRI